MSTAKTKAKQPPIIYRREPWADVDDEIRTLTASIKQLAADEEDAAYKLQDTRWRAVGKALQVARSSLDKLEEKRALIMAGAWVEPVVAKVAPAPVREHAKWEINEAVLKGGAPEYPKAARPGDRDVWNEGQDKFREFWIQASQDALRKAGTSPDQKVDLELVATLRGIEEARWLWLSARCKALESRLEAMEEGKVIGVKYLGTYQRAMTYDKGSVVTHQGDMWTCLQNVAEGIVPGSNTAAWQLSSRNAKPVTVTKPRASK